MYCVLVDIDVRKKETRQKSDIKSRYMKSNRDWMWLLAGSIDLKNGEDGFLLSLKELAQILYRLFTGPVSLPCSGYVS